MTRKKTSQKIRRHQCCADLYATGGPINKELMRVLGFAAEVALVEKGICPMCKQPVEAAKLKDEATKAEYRISGLCPDCQNDVFVRL